MCYDPKDRPPDPPGQPGTARGEDLVLTSLDGTRFMAYLAQPDKPTGAQLLIYPDVRGLHDFYKALVMHFAEMGVRSLAIDYFGRTAGLTARDASFEHMPHVQQTTLAQILKDTEAGLGRLRDDAPANAPTFILGFCFGGSLALAAGTENLDLNGVIAFYGGLSRSFSEGKGTPLDFAKYMRVPVLGLYGGADQGIPREKVEELNHELDEAGVEHEIYIYPGAPHSFFDRKAEEFADASTDAWKRAFAFIQKHSKQAA